MRRGYIRTVVGGLTVGQQASILADAGIDVTRQNGVVFIDDRDAAIASLEPHDELVIANPSCLGATSCDVLGALAAIGVRSATVLVVSDNTRVAWHPDAQAPLEFAVEAGKAARRAKTAEMRRARAASGNLGQARFELTPAKLATLRRLESEGTTREQQAEALGCSRATLQRKIRELTSNNGVDT